MRTLLILGGLMVFVLLVTPSDGDRRAKPGKKQDGGEKLMNFRDLRVPAGPRGWNIEEKPAKLPCCGWGDGDSCKKCSSPDSLIGGIERIDDE